MKDISIEFCGKKFVNPFVIAASPSSDGVEKVERAFEAGWGGVVLKTIEPAGKQRTLAEPNMGALDYAGRKQMAFYNYDLCTQLRLKELCDEIEYLKKKFPDRIIIASIMAQKDEEWKEMVHAVENAGADMIECSISCPQGDGTGKIPASDPELLEECVKSIKRHIQNGTPMIVKMTPNITDIAEAAKAAQRGGADSVCGIDTVKSFIGIDIETGKPKLNVDGRAALGGLSGPAIKPIALGCIVQMAQNVSIPIGGVGGISNYEDALEFMLLGCRIVEICTAVSKYGFGMIKGLCLGLERYMERKNIDCLEQIMGNSLAYVVPQDQLSRSYHAINKTDNGKCKKCKACIIACQDCGFGALSVGSDGYPVLNTQKCIGCGVCKTVCFADCISIEE